MGNGIRITAEGNLKKSVCRRGLEPAAFTLASLLVVIGLIFLLLAVAYFGYNSILREMRIASTKVTLHALSGMAEELEATGGWNRIEAEASPSWYYLGATEVLPGDVTADGQDRYDGTVMHTSYVTAELARVPSNATAMTKLPSRVFVAPAQQQPMPKNPVVLDAWDNPILFVPSGGMTNVWIGGVWHGPDNPMKSPSGRSFFVSAGPKGNFMEGDGFIYSFD